MALIPGEFDNSNAWNAEETITVTEGSFKVQKTKDGTIARVRFTLGNITTTAKSFSTVITSGYRPNGSSLGFIGIDDAGNIRQGYMTTDGTVVIKTGQSTGFYGQILFRPN